MRKGEKRKQELLTIAYRMFSTRGYENTSVDDIIEEAGIAKGTYYYKVTAKNSKKTATLLKKKFVVK